MTAAERAGISIAWRHKFEDVIARLGHVERSMADHSVQLAEINTKLDRLDAPVTRIEKRLDLVER